MPPGRVVGAVGLGAMGGAMAANLLRAGYEVVGFDLDGSRCRALERSGGRAVPSTAAVAESCDGLLLTSLPSDDSLLAVCDEVAMAEKAGGRARQGGELIVAELSTLSVAAKESAQVSLAAAGVTLLDCPVSGTASQAAEGDLVVYASGDADACEAARPVLLALGRSVHELGAFGNGSRTKLAANLLVAVHIVAAAEALLLAQRAGLDDESTLRALTDGAGTSRMLEVRGPRMIARRFDDPSMTVELFGKDLRLIGEMARAVGSPTPLLEAAAAWFAAAANDGWSSQDTASVFAALSASGEVDHP